MKGMMDKTDVGGGRGGKLYIDHFFQDILGWTNQFTS